MTLDSPASLNSLVSLLSLVSLASLLQFANVAQSVITPGNLKQAIALPLPIKVDGNVIQTTTVIDSNWLYYRNKNGYENCFDGNGWVSKYCTDPVACANNCLLEGAGNAADISSTYGVSVSGNSLRLNYVTTHQYGTNKW